MPLIDWVGEHWNEPDEGIWETRGGQQHFLYSRLMCWVAMDRGIRLARKRSFPAPLEKWIKLRDAIFDDIHAQFLGREAAGLRRRRTAQTRSMLPRCSCRW